MMSEQHEADRAIAKPIARMLRAASGASPAGGPAARPRGSGVNLDRRKKSQPLRSADVVFSTSEVLNTTSALRSG